jgi:polar amino acid transport system substrate-binding protein
MSDTAEREKTLDFVDFLKDGLGMLVQKGNPKAINDLPDLCGKTVAVLQGSLSVPLVQKTSDECKTDGKSPIDLKQFTEHSDAVVALQSGKADVVFVGVGQGKYDAATAGDGKLFDMSPGGPYLPSPFGIAIPKDETQLRDAIQAALQALVDNGTYDKILTQIGRSDGAYKTIPINDANAAGK